MNLQILGYYADVGDRRQLRHQALRLFLFFLVALGMNLPQQN